MEISFLHPVVAGMELGWLGMGSMNPLSYRTVNLDRRGTLNFSGKKFILGWGQGLTM